MLPVCYSSCSDDVIVPQVFAEVTSLSGLRDSASSPVAFRQSSCRFAKSFCVFECVRMHKKKVTYMTQTFLSVYLMVYTGSRCLLVCILCGKVKLSFFIALLLYLITVTTFLS